MALVYSSGSGVAGDQFEHPTVNGQRSVVLQELGATGPAGPTGATGPIGPTGPTGPTGATGPADVGATQSQIGWAPSASLNGNVLTLVAAGHPAGLYEMWVMGLIRTVATGSTVFFGCTLSATLAGGIGLVSLTNLLTVWIRSDALGVGAVANRILPSRVITAAVNNGQLPASLALVIPSTGATAITLQPIASTLDATAVLDVYAVGRLIGQ